MSEWGSCKARTLYRALLGIGWSLKREGKGSHRILEHPGFPDFTFAFHGQPAHERRITGADSRVRR